MKRYTRQLEELGFHKVSTMDFEREPFGFGLDGNNRTERISFYDGEIYACAAHNQGGETLENEEDDEYYAEQTAPADCADPIALLDAWLMADRMIVPGIRHEGA